MSLESLETKIKEEVQKRFEFVDKLKYLEQRNDNDDLILEQKSLEEKLLKRKQLVDSIIKSRSKKTYSSIIIQDYIKGLPLPDIYVGRLLTTKEDKLHQLIRELNLENEDINRKLLQIQNQIEERADIAKSLFSKPFPSYIEKWVSGRSIPLHLFKSQEIFIINTEKQLDKAEEAFELICQGNGLPVFLHEKKLSAKEQVEALKEFIDLLLPNLSEKYRKYSNKRDLCLIIDIILDEYDKEIENIENRGQEEEGERRKFTQEEVEMVKQQLGKEASKFSNIREIQKK
jgi:hypothetical protein